ncbi:hypothetical protein [Sphingomonas sp. MS122]|uniref:hypothetical protein n=1 Tax=Sphingomonas sp. MS122 TaxID=3412683 RepID=UPI003C2B2932
MRQILAFASLAVLAGCVAPSAPPPAPSRPLPVPAPAPAPAPPPPASSDWRDWPLTPGNWIYRPDARGSLAIYGGTDGGGALVLQCQREARQFLIAVGGVPSGSFTIRTSSATRVLPIVSGRAALPANDPLIDAMGFSRGRFIVERPGAPPLVVPAWAEVLRVAEDCRA